MLLVAAGSGIFVVSLPMGIIDIDSEDGRVSFVVILGMLAASFKSDRGIIPICILLLALILEDYMLCDEPAYKNGGKLMG